MSAAEIASVSCEFDIFADKPFPTSVLGTIETAYKPIALVDQNDLEFLIPADKNIYIHLDIKLYVRGKLVSGSGKDVDASDYTADTNNFHQSLFSHCNFVLNGVTITQESEHYNYHSYLETVLTYGTDAAATHFTNAYWYRETGDMLLCDPSAVTLTATTNRGFITGWDKRSATKYLQLFGRDLFKVTIVLLLGVSLQIGLTKAHPCFYMMSKEADSKTTFKFLDPQLLAKRVKPDPVMLLALTATVGTVALARYNKCRTQEVHILRRIKIPVYRERCLGPNPQTSPFHTG